MLRHRASQASVGLENTTIERPPEQVERFLIPSSVLQHTLHGLRGYAPAEGLCYWFGRALDPTTAIVQVVAFPRIYSSERWFHLAEGQMAQLTAWSQRHGLWLLSQVHTHPANEPHSDADDAWAPTKRRGFLSIIIPFSALLSATHNIGWSCYEWSDAGQWVAADTTRLHVFDDVWFPKG